MNPFECGACGGTGDSTGADWCPECNGTGLLELVDGNIVAFDDVVNSEVRP